MVIVFEKVAEDVGVHKALALGAILDIMDKSEGVPLKGALYFKATPKDIHNRIPFVTYRFIQYALDTLKEKKYIEVADFIRGHFMKVGETNGIQQEIAKSYPSLYKKTHEPQSVFSR